MSAVLQPRTARRHAAGLGSCAFARHYSRNHCYFLFLRVLRCFSSPGSPLQIGGIHRCGWVAPFGNPRVNGYLPLTAAYRSLSRPSSPPRAKASFMCPFLLSLVFQLREQKSSALVLFRLKPVNRVLCRTYRTAPACLLCRFRFVNFYA